MQESYRVDVAILGAGFAGSLTAMILSRIGLRTILVERERHPRFALGEASTPFANLLLLQLARRYDLPDIANLAKYGPWKRAFPHLPTWRKRGFSFFRHHRDHPFRPTPDHAEELLVAASPDDETSDTHWYRPSFDAFLVVQAETGGILYFDQTETAVVESNPEWLLRCDRDGKRFEVRCRFLIDASGPGGFLTEALRLPPSLEPMKTNSRSVYAHLTGVRSWEAILRRLDAHLQDYPYPCDHSTIHHIFDGGWMWVIPFDNGITSVGLMLDGEHWKGIEGQPAEDQWNAVTKCYPSMQEQFAKVEAVETWRASRRLQRCVDRCCGPNWALLPHAAYALDALFSIGNGHTLLGIERLAKTLEAHWNRDSLLAALQLDAETLRQEIRFNDALIRACYRSFRSFRLFAATSMLYFAGAHAAELARSSVESQRACRFLSSHVLPFARAVHEAAQRVDAAYEEAEIRDYEAWIREAIAPINFGGFADPSKHNLYPCQ